MWSSVTNPGFFRKKIKNVTPMSGWSNNGGVYKELGYKITVDNTVKICGVISDGTRSINTRIGVFPKPKNAQFLMSVGEQGTAQFYIDNQGNVFIWSIPVSGWISLDGCTYELD